MILETTEKYVFNFIELTITVVSGGVGVPGVVASVVYRREIVDQ